MADEVLRTHVEADASGFVTGMKHAEEALEGFFKGLGSGTFTGIAEGVSSLVSAAGPLAIVAGAALAVHEAFKLVGEAVEETQKWNLEAGKLSRQLGITTQEASVLANSLEDHGVSVDSYTASVAFMTRALINGSVGFKNLGLETRNADGSFRNSNQLMGEAIDKLNAMPDGTQKNIIGQQLFGRAWLNNRDILLVGSKALAETNEQMDKLGTKVTPQTEAASRRYALALADVHDVLNAFAINLGNKLLPTLTEFLHWVGDVGTVVVQGFRAALDVLGDAFTFVGRMTSEAWGALSDLASAILDVLLPPVETLINIFTGWFGGEGLNIVPGFFKLVTSVVVILAGAIEQLWGVASTVFTALTNTVGVAAKALLEFVQGEYSQAWNTVKTGATQVLEDVNASWDKNVAAAERSKARLDEIWSTPKKPATETAEEEKRPAALGNVDTGKDKTGELVKEWKQQLDEIKSLRENWYTWDSGRELAFWEDKLRQTHKGTDAYKAVLSEIVKARKDVSKAELDAQQESIRGSIDAAKAASDAEIAEFQQMEKRKADALKAAAAVSSDKAKSAQEVALLGATEDQKVGIVAAGVKSQMVAEQKLADDLAQIRKEDLAGTIRLEQAKLDAALERMDKLRALAGSDEKAQEKITNDQVKLVQESNKKISTLKAAEADAEVKDANDRAKRIDAIQAAADKKEAERKKAFTKQIQSYLDPFVTGFSDGIKKILDGTLSFTDAIKGMGQMLVTAFGNVIAKMVTDWIASLAEMAAQWLANLLFQKATQESTTAAGMATAAAARTTQAAGMAAVLAVNAAASAAAVPFLGWLVFPEVMAAAYAAGMSMVPLAAAAGGFDVPSGMNPVTQLHAEEMVLPAHLANTVREMAALGTSAAPSSASQAFSRSAMGGSMPVQVNIQALDGPSVARVLRGNERQVAKVFRELARDRKVRG